VTSPFRLDEVSLAHFLPWWWIGDRVMVLHDGALVTAYAVEGIDIACETDERVNLVAQRLRSLLNALPVGYQLQFLRHAHVANGATFEPYLRAAPDADPILREQRERAAAHLGSLNLRQFDTYLLLSRPRALGKLGSAFADPLTRLVDRIFGAKDRASITRHEHELAAEELAQTGDALSRYLATTGVRATRADDQTLVSLTYAMLNPGRARHAVPTLVDELPAEIPDSQRKLYRPLSLREQLVDSGLSWDVDLLYLDDPLRPHRVLTVKALPPRTLASLIRGAHRLPFDHWFSIGLAVPDSERHYEDVDKRRKRAHANASGHVRNVAAEEQEKELEQVLKSMISRDQRVFQLSAHVLIGAQNIAELDFRTREAIDVFRTHLGGTVLATETYGQLPAFLGMLAGNAHRAPHKKTVLTDNAADLLPVYKTWRGDDRPLFMAQTRTGEPFQLDVADPRRDNWNSTVFGQSGGGKTFLTLSLITSSMLPLKSPLVVVDVGGRDPQGKPLGSYYRLAQMMGGDYVDLSLDGANAINPFYSRADLFTTDAGRPADAPNPLKLLFLGGILKILVQDPGTRELTTVQESILQRAILGAYARLADARPPLLSDVIAELEQLPLERDDRANARGYAKTLRAWIDGPHGRLLNQPSRVNPRSQLVVFDVKGIESAGRLADVMISIVSAYVWNMISRPRSELGWVIYDECWKLLQNPVAAALVAELYRTARKLRAGAISITQRLDDFLASPASGAILANAPATFLLKHKDSHELVAARVSLNERELELFKGLATEKGQYSEFFYKSDRGSAVVRNAPCPFDYWVNTTEARDRDLEDQVLEQCHGNRLAALRRLATEYPNGAIAGRKAA
jgi:type IV secretory pathway VirB4 component